MIFDALIGLVLGVFSTIIGVLPSGTVTWGADASYVGQTVSAYLLIGNQFVESWLLVTVITALLTVVLPAILVYELAQWAYRELPQIFGFGP